MLNFSLKLIYTYIHIYIYIYIYEQRIWIIFKCLNMIEKVLNWRAGLDTKLEWI